jgi:hypothetical protein
VFFKMSSLDKVPTVSIDGLKSKSSLTKTRKRSVVLGNELQRGINDDHKVGGSNPDYLSPESGV